MSTRERPLSPFLIYRPQLTSVLSILHRISGIFLSLAALLLAAWLLALAGGPQAYAAVHGFFNSGAGTGSLVLVSAAFFYHLCNGVRHLFWDAGLGLELKQAYASGWAVLAATLVLTLGFWLAAFGVGG